MKEWKKYPIKDYPALQERVKQMLGTLVLKIYKKERKLESYRPRDKIQQLQRQE